MGKPRRTRWIVRALLLAVGGSGLMIVVLLMESRRPLVELEREGASIVQDSDGNPRTISFCRPEASDRHLALMCRFPTLTSINLSRSSVTAAGVRRLQELPHLDAFDLSETENGEGIPAVLAAFPGLRTLHLRRCPWLTDDAVEVLSQLESLECLTLVGTPITDRGLTALSQCRNLKQLGIDSCPGVTDEGLRQLARVSRLESVSVSGCEGVSDAGVSELAGLPSLRALSACEIPMRRDALRNVTARKPDLDLSVNRFEFPELQPLIDIGARIGLDARYEVSWIEIDDRRADPSTAYPYLQTTHYPSDYSGFEGDTEPVVLDEDGLAVIEAVPDLAALRLKSVPLTKSGFRSIARLRELQSLVLENVSICDDDLRNLADCRSLEVLWIRRAPITGEGVAALSSLPRLRELSLLSDRLSQAGFDAATSLHNLDTLAVGDVSTISTAAQISRMPKLTILAMVRGNLTGDDVRLLADIPQLQQLELLHSTLSEDALLSMEDLPALKMLYLSRCDFDRAALGRLRERRPDLAVFGMMDMSRPPRTALPHDQRRLLGGIPLFVPVAPTPIH